jgi:hypothetical protein
MQSIVPNRDNFTFKYFDIENSKDLENLKELFLKNLPPLENFFNPLNLNVKEFLGLEVTHSILIHAKPNSHSTIHVDYRADQLKLALNIPLKNCENSVTNMWSCEGEPTYLETPTGIPYNNYNKQQCEKITRFFLTRPVIFNTKIPHSVSNFSDQPRLAISLRFKEDPWELVGL